MHPVSVTITALCLLATASVPSLAAARRASPPEPHAAVADAERHGINFVSVCNFSHEAPDDPIVHPGQPGASHLHQFFGNTATAADSTVESMLASGTTCHRLGDTGAYWVPALLDGGEVIRPSRATAYYTAAGKDPASIEPFPADLRVVAGGNVNGVPVTRWDCLADGEPFVTGSTTVPGCADGESLAARIFFPDCWNGVDTDSADHRSHLAYSVRGTCPSGYEVPVPRLRLTIRYPGSDGGSDVTLSSGAPDTAHADFWNTWDQQELERLVAECLNDGRACGLRGGRV